MSCAIPLWPDGAPGHDSANPSFAPTITPYPCPGAAEAGAVVVCPGGGYAGRAAHESEPIARWLNSVGLHAFACDYRVAPYRYPYPWLDACRAVRWVRSHAASYGVRPRQVGLLGFSAGAHLTAWAGTRPQPPEPAAGDPIDHLPSRPDALVLCYPVISFESWGHQGSMRNLLGDDPDPTLVASLCTETAVTADTPPAFLWHTADDPGVSVRNSLEFAGALSRHGVPFELHVYPSGRHGLGLAEDDPHVGSWTALCGQWLIGMGFGA